MAKTALNWAVGMLVAATMLAGCGSKATHEATTSSGSKPGWHQVTVPSAGFSIQVPPDWQAINLTDSDWEKLLQAAAESNAAIKDMAPQLRQAVQSGAMALIAFGQNDQRAKFVENLNVVITPDGGRTKPGDLADAYKVGMRAMTVPGESPSAEPVSLPAGEGARGTSRLALGRGGAAVASLCYILPHDGKHFTITFSSSVERAEAVRKVAEEMMTTFKFE